MKMGPNRCIPYFPAFAAALAGIALIAPGRAHGAPLPAPTAPPVAACPALLQADFNGVLDAPTRLSQARLIAAQADTPGYCEVIGQVAPSVGFVLRLPADHWNGKFFQEGCGGFCGGYNLEVKAGPYGFLGPLRRGYAHLVFDGGHVASPMEARWAQDNLQAQFDFGVRAPHVAALAGKVIVAHYYRRPPRHSYFAGCSSGGQQALSQAQRFPWDFDGILVGAPSPTFSGPMLNYLWAGRALAGKVSEADLQRVHAHAVAQCDMDDGIKDGIIGNPTHCRADPADLQCRPGQASACLSAVQVAAVGQVYAGPTTSSGERIYTGGPLRGSELNWIRSDGATAYVDAAGNIAPWSREYFAHAGFMPAPGAGWQVADFDFDRDYKRLRLAESLFGAADNPDLRRFKAAGGKMIMYQGLQDESDIPADAIDYYQTVQRTMGGPEATRSFFRFFAVPGMNHCFGGPGAYAIDYLAYLEAWVEQGQAPQKMIGAHIADLTPERMRQLTFPLDPAIPVQFTRPVYPYPLRAHYLGHGDPDAADSFGPVAPDDADAGSARDR